MFDSLKNKNKYGFSLFEVVVTMTIVSIFIAACSNVFTQRHKKRIITPIHGRFECYRDEGGNVHQRLFNEEVLVSETTLGNGADVRCTFTPPKQALYLLISAVAAGGTGGCNYGGSSGSYKEIFLSRTDHILHMIPGRASENANMRGGNTKIYDKGISGTDDDKILVDLKGGKSNSGSKMTLKDCKVATRAFNCGLEPSCSIVEPEYGDGYISVTYCQYDFKFGSGAAGAGENALRTVKIPYSTQGYDDYDDKCNDLIYVPFRSTNRTMKSILQEQGTTDLETLYHRVLTYSYTRQYCSYPDSLYDIKEVTYFKVNLTLDGNYTAQPEFSLMSGYVNSIYEGNNNGMAATRGVAADKRGISTGDGGPKNGIGGHGAVLVTW